MPALLVEVGVIIDGIADATGIAYGALSAIATVLEYAATAALLNAAQKALSPSQKSGIGPGLESNFCDLRMTDNTAPPEEI